MVENKTIQVLVSKKLAQDLTIILKSELSKLIFWIFNL